MEAGRGDEVVLHFAVAESAEALKECRYVAQSLKDCPVRAVIGTGQLLPEIEAAVTGMRATATRWVFLDRSRCSTSLQASATEEPCALAAEIYLAEVIKDSPWARAAEEFELTARDAPPRPVPPGLVGADAEEPAVRILELLTTSRDVLLRPADAALLRQTQAALAGLDDSGLDRLIRTVPMHLKGRKSPTRLSASEEGVLRELAILDGFATAEPRPVRLVRLTLGTIRALYPPSRSKRVPKEVKANWQCLLRVEPRGEPEQLEQLRAQVWIENPPPAPGTSRQPSAYSYAEIQDMDRKSLETALMFDTSRAPDQARAIKDRKAELRKAFREIAPTILSHWRARLEEAQSVVLRTDAS